MENFGHFVDIRKSILSVSGNSVPDIEFNRDLLDVSRVESIQGAALAVVASFYQHGFHIDALKHDEIPCYSGTRSDLHAVRFSYRVISLCKDTFLVSIGMWDSVHEPYTTVTKLGDSLGLIVTRITSEYLLPILTGQPAASFLSIPAPILKDIALHAGLVSSCKLEATCRRLSKALGSGLEHLPYSSEDATLQGTAVGLWQEFYSTLNEQLPREQFMVMDASKASATAVGSMKVSELKRRCRDRASRKIVVASNMAPRDNERHPLRIGEPLRGPSRGGIFPTMGGGDDVCPFPRNPLGHSGDRGGIGGLGGLGGFSGGGIYPRNGGGFF